MSAVFETKDVLLALSFYMEHGGHGEQRLKELQETFEEIATDKVKLIKEQSMSNEIKEAIEYFNGWEEGDNITITSDFIMYAEVLKELEERSKA